MKIETLDDKVMAREGWLSEHAVDEGDVIKDTAGQEYIYTDMELADANDMVDIRQNRTYLPKELQDEFYPF